MTTVYMLEVTDRWSDYDRGESEQVAICTTLEKAQEIAEREEDAELEWLPVVLHGKTVHWFCHKSGSDTHYGIYPMNLDERYKVNQ